MRLVICVLLLGALLVPAAAVAQMTTCALFGEYAGAASLHLQQGEAQFSGRFTFQPPAACAADAPGTVQVVVSVLMPGAVAPVSGNGTLPYTVDATGRLVMPGFLHGQVAGLASYSVANTFTFEGDLGPVVRLVGTAVRVAAVAAPLRRVVDGNGTPVGETVTFDSYSAHVILAIGGQPRVMYVTSTGFSIGGSFLYLPPDTTCSTSPYVSVPSVPVFLPGNELGRVVDDNRNLYVALAGAPVVNFSGSGSMRSFYEGSPSSGSCSATNFGSFTAARATLLVNLNSLGYLAPFHLE